MLRCSHGPHRQTQHFCHVPTQAGNHDARLHTQAPRHHTLYFMQKQLMSTPHTMQSSVDHSCWITVRIRCGQTEAEKAYWCHITTLHAGLLTCVFSKYSPATYLPLLLDSE